MNLAASHRWLTRAQIALALLFGVGICGGLGYGALHDPGIALLPPGGGAPWITDPMPVHTQGMWIPRAHPRPRVFERRFVAPDGHGPLTLRVRALREIVLTLNGTRLDLGARDPLRWRAESVIDVTTLVSPGENLLQAEVRNPTGAPLLALRIDGLPGGIATGPDWLAARSGDPLRPALLADDGRRHPDSLVLPAPSAALWSCAPVLFGLFVAGVGAWAWLRRRPALAVRAPAAALLFVTFVWSWLFVRSFLRIPSGVGFDAASHVEYVRWILEHGTLPSAGAGTAMYHPPLFHALAAAGLALFHPTPGGVGEKALLSILPAVAGLGMAWVGGALARSLAPAAPWLAAGAIIAAGLLPMNLVLAATVSNETLHALLAGLAVLVTVRLLLVPRATTRGDLAQGALLGAALLTKYTTAPLVPVLVGIVGLKRLVAERTGLARALAGAAASLAVALALAGWVYVRNFVQHGDAFVWNLDADPARTWWQLPGFHTPGYFLRFGDALTRPWLSGFHGFWDSVYTTLWGDGQLGGAASAHGFHGVWRLDFMAAVFLLAVPATLLLLAGWWQAAERARHDGDLGRRLAFTLLAFLPPLLLALLVGVNLRFPFWSLGKAFYALLLTPAFGLLIALGFEGLDRRLARRAPAAVRALPFGWAAASCGAILLAFGA